MGDIGYAVLVPAQQIASALQASVDDIAVRRQSRAGFEDGRKMMRAQVRNPGQLRETERLMQVIVDVADDPPQRS